MVYRVCKAFEVESGHRLSKHPGRCRYPHGHSRRVEVVVASAELDENDIECDFAALKAALGECLDRLDHAMAVTARIGRSSRSAGRGLSVDCCVFQGKDPTTELLAKHIHDFLVDPVVCGVEVPDERGRGYRPRNLLVERVRVGRRVARGRSMGGEVGGITRGCIETRSDAEGVRG